MALAAVEAFFGDPLAPEVVEEGWPPCAYRGASRCWDGGRSCCGRRAPRAGMAALGDALARSSRSTAFRSLSWDAVRTRPVGHVGAARVAASPPSLRANRLAARYGRSARSPKRDALSGCRSTRSPT